MTPYYQDEAVTIYHGDCRDLLGSLPHSAALVTDPPYGIKADLRQSNRAGKRHGKAVAASRDYGVSNWDSCPAEVLPWLRFKQHVIWGGNHFGLPPTPGWLVWDKETGTNGYADCELAWTDLQMAIRRFRFQWMGMLQQISEERYHPTQKPVPVMRWSVGFTDQLLIIDPFMGSGTTLRAAKDLGRKAIGIEIEERYCEIAARRMCQEVLAI